MAALVLLPQAIILGLLFGGVYALAGSGLTLTFGVMRIINIAHGSFIIIAAYFAYAAFIFYGVDPILSIAIGAPTFFALGLLVYRILFARVSEAPVANTVIITVGLALLIENLLAFGWTSTPKSVTPFYSGSSVVLAGIYISSTKVVASAMSVIALTGLFLFLWRARTGRAIRATIQDRKAAQLVGVNVDRISAIAFATGMATAAAAGAMISVLTAFNPTSDLLWVQKLLSVVVLGGMQSLKGLVVAALILGIAESVATVFVSLSWSPMVFFVFIIGILLIRPQGLFGEKLR